MVSTLAEQLSHNRGVEYLFSRIRGPTLTNSFLRLSSVPRAWFLKITSSSHLPRHQSVGFRAACGNHLPALDVEVSLRVQEGIPQGNVLLALGLFRCCLFSLLFSPVSHVGKAMGKP
jgi:hypothetical protein